MARLKNIENKLLLELILYPDPDSYDWITYEIIIRSASEDGKILLSLTSPDDTLYFDAYYEPEIPKLCSGIVDVVNGEKLHFFFEPADEKDFQFKIEKSKNELFINIYSDDFTILENYKWDYKSYLGIKMHVKKDDIFDFVKQLKAEYEQIESKFPGKTFLPKSKKNI